MECRSLISRLLRFVSLWMRSLGLMRFCKCSRNTNKEQKTPDILQRVLKLAPADFDRAFNDYIKAKTSGWIEAIGSGPAQAPGGQPPSKEVLLALVKAKPNDYFAHLRLGTLYKKEAAEQAIEH